MEQRPLAWWDLGGTRRAVAFTFIAGVAVLLLALFPEVERFYNVHSTFKSFIDALVVLSGLGMAFLELKHSGDANEHRAELVRLTDQANDYRREANQLDVQRLELQTRVQVLQEEIERKLTKVRLYLRARNGNAGIELWASNLSDFDLWVNQVRLVVTEAITCDVGTHVIAGGTQISRGYN